MKVITIFQDTGDFAENKDKARDIRRNTIENEIMKGNQVTIDFKGVASATQSFVHALISEVIRVHGVEVLKKIAFKNCNEKVRTIIEIVVEYVQDGIYTEPEDN